MAVANNSQVADSNRRRKTSHIDTRDRDVHDSETVTYKKALAVLQKECDSYKKFAAANGVTTIVATGLFDGFFRIGGIKIALDPLLCASAKIMVITGTEFFATVISAGIATFVSLVLDVCKCFIYFWKEKYCPTDKQLNRSLFFKELINVIGSSLTCAAITVGIGIIVCIFATTVGAMIAGLLCATGLSLLAKYAMQHGLRFGKWWGHKLKQYKYDKWAKKENNNNNNNDYKLWESLKLFFNCVKEWEIERLIAQCKLDISDIEKRYRDKKRRLGEKYYGIDNFESIQEKFGQNPTIDEQFILDLVCLRKDRKTLTVYVNKLQQFAKANEVDFSNNNNSNNNNNNSNGNNKLDESKDDSKTQTESIEDSSYTSSDNNSCVDNFNIKVDISNEANSSKVHTESGVRRSLPNNNDNKTDEHDENNNKQIEEMAADEEKFVQDVTKEIFEEFSKWSKLFRDCRYAQPKCDDDISTHQLQSCSLINRLTKNVANSFNSHVSCTSVSANSDALTHGNNNHDNTPSTANSSITGISDNNNNNTNSSGNNDDGSDSYVNKTDQRLNIQGIADDISFWLSDYNIDRSIAREYETIYGKSQGNNDAIKQVTTIYRKTKRMQQQKQDKNSQAKHFQNLIQDFIHDFGDEI